MSRLFKQLAKEGKAITLLRQSYAKQGFYISAHRAEILIMFTKLKKKFKEYQKQN